MKHDINLLLSLRERRTNKQNWLRIGAGLALLVFLLIGVAWPQLTAMQRRSVLAERQQYSMKLAPIEERFLSTAANRNFRNHFAELIDKWANTPLTELDVVKATLPEGARTTSIALRNGTITIQGSAVTDQDVAAFVGALRKVSGYYGVTLVQSDQADAGAAWEFTVEWMKENPNPSPTPAPTLLYQETDE